MPKWRVRCSDLLGSQLDVVVVVATGLMSLVTWAFPAFDGEFHDGQAGQAFWHQLGRKDGWRFHAIDWSRRRKTAPFYD